VTKIVEPDELALDGLQHDGSCRPFVACAARPRGDGSLPRDQDQGWSLPRVRVGAHRAADVDEAGAVIYRSGNTRVLVYASEYAGTNEGTAASWTVGGDFDAILDELRNKGVTFEHYALPGTTREGDVHVMGDLRAAWFKDPDGNILNVVSQPG
jgi:hypothetical protein